MNLPSEVVIIGGDSRFDPGTDRMEQLEAHELLNAAGRAGRAGEGSYGFVLVVPSKVVDFNNETSAIHNHWADLQAIFAQSDQCLVIDDPMTPLLDQIHIAAAPTSSIANIHVLNAPLAEGQVAARRWKRDFTSACSQTTRNRPWRAAIERAGLASIRYGPSRQALVRDVPDGSGDW